MKKDYSRVSPEALAQKSAVLLQWLEEHKGGQPVALELTGQGAFTDCLVVASASSVRHAQSLADGLSRLCKENGYEFLGMEGRQTGEWILLDLNEIVVNIFQGPARDLYRLESLWSAGTALPAAPPPTEEARP